MITHRGRTVKSQHSPSSAKSSAKSVRFATSYLEGLMAELDRAAISIRMGQSREQAGLTQPEIADLLHPPVHFRSVQDWESPRKRVVPFDRLDEWARLTKSTREWLIYGEEAIEGDRLARVEQRLEELFSLVETLRHDLGLPAQARRSGTPQDHPRP